MIEQQHYSHMIMQKLTDYQQQLKKTLGECFKQSKIKSNICFYVLDILKSNESKTTVQH